MLASWWLVMFCWVRLGGWCVGVLELLGGWDSGLESEGRDGRLGR